MITNPTNEHKEQARELESIFVVIGEIGGVWATFDTREKAERYPGPRMLELAARQIIEYVPTSALSSRDAKIREVLEGFGSREDRYAGGLCWCDKDLTDDREPHSKHCETVNALHSKLAPLQIENPPDTLRE